MDIDEKGAASNIKTFLSAVPLQHNGERFGKSLTITRFDLAVRPCSPITKRRPHTPKQGTRME